MYEGGVHTLGRINLGAVKDTLPGLTRNREYRADGVDGPQEMARLRPILLKCI